MAIARSRRVEQTLFAAVEGAVFEWVAIAEPKGCFVPVEPSVYAGCRMAFGGCSIVTAHRAGEVILLCRWNAQWRGQQHSRTLYKSLRTLCKVNAGAPFSVSTMEYRHREFRYQ